jgi:sec-independent protein translocase protein TatA
MFTGALQPMHLLIILIIALVVFGPSKLPELGSSLGKGIREFRKTTDEFRDIKEDVTAAVSLQPVAKRPAAVSAPLPTQPEPRNEPVALQRQEID